MRCLDMKSAWEMQCDGKKADGGSHVVRALILAPGKASARFVQHRSFPPIFDQQPLFIIFHISFPQPALAIVHSGSSPDARCTCLCLCPCLWRPAMTSRGHVRCRTAG